MRNVLTILLLAITALAAADDGNGHIVTASTYFEVMEAAAFTDGHLVECAGKNLDPEHIWRLCVDTRSTGWNASQLRGWSDYGLSHWRVFNAWRFSESGDVWMLTLVHLARDELLSIGVTVDGSYVFYVVVTE